MESSAPDGLVDSRTNSARAEQQRPTSMLDRTIDLSAVSWSAIGWTGVILVAIAVRFANLDVWALSPDEAFRAFHAFSFYDGRPSPPGAELPTTSPLFLVLQSLGFFLFGATDATARIMPAMLGLALVILIAGLRPFVGRPAALGMAALAAISPTLVFASRTADPEIAVAVCTLLLIIAVLRAGLADTTPSSLHRWGLTAGVALGALLASGPSALSVLIALGAGIGFTFAFDREPTPRQPKAEHAAPTITESGAVRRGLTALGGSREALGLFGLGLFATVATLFTRLFSDIPALAGLGSTFGDWGSLLGGATTGTPIQFFLLAALLYEIVAITFAVVAVNRGRVESPGALGWPFLAGWFVAALLLFSLSAGRSPEQAIHIVLPLVLLGGGAIGELFAAVNWRETLRGHGGLLLLAFLGLFIAVVSGAILAGRVDDAVDQTQAMIRVVVAGLVILLFVVAAYALIRNPNANDRIRRPAAIALLAVLIVLGIYTIRATTLLNYYESDEGRELLAQSTATAAVRPMVARLERLSRDATVTEGSVRDPTGGHGLSIAVDQRLQWPFRWYFRDFPDLQVVAPGQAPLQAAQVVVAPTEEGMAEAGFTPRPYPFVNRIPAAYSDPNIGQVIQDLVVPSHWRRGARYLLFRDLAADPDPETISVGFNAELTARLLPNSGPYGLFDRAGAGRGRGQFKQPRGIAVSPDGTTVYVVDMGNLRVERYGADGQFVGIWGGSDDPAGITFATEFEQGPTGIAVGPDGLVYVADTWGHRVVVLDPSGRQIREFGTNGDTGDAPTADGFESLFFGPRALAVSDTDIDELYVVDTGNERVQVFGLDGTYRRAFGGKGSEPGQFIEPVGITIGPDDRVYVADSGNARISIFDQQGIPVAQWPVAAWNGRSFFEPYLAFDTDGNLYATSADTGSVEVFAPDGTPQPAIRQIGNETLEGPVGIAAAPDGSLLITDGTRHTVLRYTPEPSLLLPDGTGEIIDPPLDGEVIDPPQLPGVASPTSGTLPDPPSTNG